MRMMPRLSPVRARVCSCAHTRIDARAGAAPRRRRAAAIGRAIRRQAIGRAIRRAIGRAIGRQAIRGGYACAQWPHARAGAAPRRRHAAAIGRAIGRAIGQAIGRQAIGRQAIRGGYRSRLSCGPRRACAQWPQACLHADSHVAIGHAWLLQLLGRAIRAAIGLGYRGRLSARLSRQAIGSAESARSMLLVRRGLSAGPSAGLSARYLRGWLRAIWWAIPRGSRRLSLRASAAAPSLIAQLPLVLPLWRICGAEGLPPDTVVASAEAIGREGVCNRLSSRV